jgi:hypothetical protein
MPLSSPVSTQPRQFLQVPPVLQPILSCLQQCRRRIALFVELFSEAAFAAREINEG